MLLILLQAFVVTYLIVVGGVQAAPAVRVGLSWARLNLHRVYDLATIGCVVGLIV